MGRNRESRLAAPGRGTGRGKGQEAGRPARALCSSGGREGSLSWRGVVGSSRGTQRVSAVMDGLAVWECRQSWRSRRGGHPTPRPPYALSNQIASSSCHRWPGTPRLREATWLEVPSGPVQSCTDPGMHMASWAQARSPPAARLLPGPLLLGFVSASSLPYWSREGTGQSGPEDLGQQFHSLTGPLRPTAWAHPVSPSPGSLAPGPRESGQHPGEGI